ncbi:MAG: hypothetical protein HKN82_01380 [Akkermansiaceae bacterium]|nr:hypothetical protein [Akkermansiaceae bacterium]NNM28167.1 hypothetical protein [Akkermansiaceae bacterium]
MARQLDGATPQPVQKMAFDGLLHFVAKQQGLAREVHTCYEAGAFGYHLHRKLVAMGVRNLVVQPQDWDERAKRMAAEKERSFAELVRRGLEQMTLRYPAAGGGGMISCDTNILFVALESSRPGHAEARAFLDARRDDPEFGICELVLIDLYMLLRNPVVARKPLGSREAGGSSGRCGRIRAGMFSTIPGRRRG